MTDAEELELYRWTTKMGLHLSENASEGEPTWCVLCVDGELYGIGDSPVEAMAGAFSGATIDMTEPNRRLHEMIAKHKAKHEQTKEETEDRQTTN
jgi:hypothetical protein